MTSNLPDKHNNPGQRALRYGRHSEPNRLYLVTTVTYNRQNFFADFIPARKVINAMQHVEMEGFAESQAWVLMPDHLHWLFGVTEKASLSNVMNIVKGRSAHFINKHLGRKGTVWQKAFHDHALRKDEDIKKVARYLVANPIRAGLVDRLTDYPHWDAIWLQERVHVRI